ncbi:MAG TPA: hypothetical protein VJB98_02750 [Candidatus Paceibacterota bacterium]
MWRGIKPERRELQSNNLGSITKVNHATTVNGVTSKTVWMPRHNSTGFTFFNLREHSIKYGTAGFFRGLGFDKRLDHLKMLSLGKFLQFGDLRFNR